MDKFKASPREKPTPFGGEEGNKRTYFSFGGEESNKRTYYDRVDLAGFELI